MRVYDPRVGRFLSVDPLTPKYPELTPYQFASNSPIRFVDLDGLEQALPEEESRYERDREELEREELHRSIGEESKESRELRDEIAREAKDNGGHWSVRTFRVLEEMFKGDAYQFKVREEIQTGKINPRFGDLRRFVLKKYDEIDAAQATAKQKMAASGTTSPPTKMSPSSNDGHSLISYQNMKTELSMSEKTSIFNKDGSIKPAAVAKSEQIINGTKLGNRDLISELTSDGSNIADWNKMSLIIKQQTPAGERSIDIHYYYNSRTQKTYLQGDYKSKLSANYFDQTPKVKK